jgi:hypothetical protein
MYVYIYIYICIHKRGRASQEGSSALDLDLFGPSFYNKTVNRRTYTRVLKDKDTDKSTDNDNNGDGIRNPINKNLNDKFNEVQETAEGGGELSGDCWIQGGEGMVLFHSDPLDGKASIGKYFIGFLLLFS